MEISLMRYIDCRPYDFSIHSRPYDFPSHLFANGKTTSVGKLTLRCCTLRIPPDLDGFNTLKAVRLVHMNIADTDFENLSSVCHALKSLELIQCWGLKRLKLSREASALKFLSVDCCLGKETIEVDAMNLVTFESSGTKTLFNLRNARITEASIGSNHCWFDVAEIPRELPLVENLKLEFFQINKVKIPPPSAHRLMHLKELTLLVHSWRKHNILWMGTILTFAPLLEKYYIKLFTHSISKKKPLTQKEGEEEPREKRHMRIISHEQLKIIKFSNFNAEEREFEPAMFMVNSTIVLEKLVIETRWEGKEDSKSSSSNQRDRCQRVNDYFVGKLPSTANLVIL